MTNDIANEDKGLTATCEIFQRAHCLAPGAEYVRRSNSSTVPYVNGFCIVPSAYKCGHFCLQMRTLLLTNADTTAYKCGHYCLQMRTLLLTNADTTAYKCGHFCLQMRTLLLTNADTTAEFSDTEAFQLYKLKALILIFLLVKILSVGSNGIKSIPNFTQI
jgi:hypothetical protein